MGFFCQEYWSGLPFPPPGDLPDLEIEPTSPAFPALAGGFFYLWATWEAPKYSLFSIIASEKLVPQRGKKKSSVVWRSAGARRAFLLTLWRLVGRHYPGWIRAVRLGMKHFLTGKTSLFALAPRAVPFKVWPHELSWSTMGDWNCKKL